MSLKRDGGHYRSQVFIHRRRLGLGFGGSVDRRKDDRRGAKRRAGGKGLGRGMCPLPYLNFLNFHTVMVAF